MEQLLFFMGIIITLYWLVRKTNINRDIPYSHQGSETSDNGHLYGLTEEKVKFVDTSWFDFLIGGFIGTAAVWIFQYLLIRNPSPELSEILDWIVVPIGFSLGGSGAVVGVELSKRLGLKINHIIVGIIGGLAVGIILGGPILICTIIAAQILYAI